jgi:ferredoxin
MDDPGACVIGPEALEELIAAIRSRGFRVLGPTVHEGAIVYDELAFAADLPIGWTDSQDGGLYRLERRADDARFGYAVGPHSWKQFLLPPHVRLWKAHRNGGGAFDVEEEPLDDRPLAFFGVRSCELHAIEIQDHVLLGGRYADRDVRAAEAAMANAAESMGRELDTSGIKELLYANLEHPRWQDVADRCLTCGNCTMVCPTCFCTSVEDVNDLDGSVERRRVWDSCFSVEYSFIHGGSVRSSARSRYRQWMTHKLATWIDQFGTSGCVGCGRCITWCPVGIDITEEVAAIRKTEEEAPDGDD